MFNYLLSTIAVAFILVSCSTAPELDRSSPFDPKSDTYKPQPPTGVNYQFNESGNVLLFWDKKSDAEYGYRVFKSLGVNNEFTLLADLEKNSNSFTDSSKIFAYPTKYHIVSFYDDIVSDTLTVNIDFGEVTSLNAEFNNNYKEITFSWSDNVFQPDGFILNSRIDSNSDSKFVAAFPNTAKQNTIQTPKFGFKQEYSLTPFKIFNNDTTTLQASEPIEVNIGPKDLELNLITVDSLQVKWKDISDSEELFLVTLTDQSGTESFEVDKNKTSLIIRKDLTKATDDVFVTVKGVNRDLSSDSIAGVIQLPLPAPTIKDFDLSSMSEVSIKVSDLSQIKREKTIYRKINNSEFVPIGTIAKGDSIFIDNSVNTSNVYSYMVQAPLSNNTMMSKSIHFTTKLTSINKVESQKRASFSTNLLAHSPYKNILAYVTTGDHWFIQIKHYLNESNSREIGLNFRMINITIDKNATKIAGTSLADSNKLYVVGINSETVDSLSFGNSKIIKIQFSESSNKIIALVKKPEENIELISIDLETKTTELLETLNTKEQLIRLHINDAKTKLVVKYTHEGSLEGNSMFRFYNLTETGIEFYNEQSAIVEYYSPFTFSANLDTTIFNSENVNELIMYDFNSQSNVFKDAYNLKNSDNLKSTTLLNDGVFYVQDVQSAFVVDTKQTENKVIQHLDFSGIPVAGEVLWNSKSKYLIDFRRSFDPNIMSYYTVLKAELGWVEVIDN